MTEKRYYVHKHLINKYKVHDKICHQFMNLSETVEHMNMYYQKYTALKKENEQLKQDNQLLKEEKELLKNKLDRIEDILPHYLSCAEISEFRSKTFKEDMALMKCWNKRYQK